MVVVTARPLEHFQGQGHIGNPPTSVPARGAVSDDTAATLQGLPPFIEFGYATVGTLSEASSASVYRVSDMPRVGNASCDLGFTARILKRRRNGNRRWST